ncbi:50S ribosomal protein L5P [Methanocella paludicola SANAE]|uniref:Large ribosomal subunit protein uL5 n=2 Tax=Methanocella TaxID=570266 RepID=D1Z0T4_METPS|nr:50S ribosomal protein L5 [Methanocella paludicola]BAI62306.1 50S ribosomal protein L5P [Methanocella paludicola SANAE]
MSDNAMRTPRIEKVTVHMSVGESGKKLSNAEMIMQTITGQKPVRNFAQKTLPAFGIKKGEAIGCKVTLRGAKAEKFLNTAFAIKEKSLNVKSFDKNGNFAFGIEEHTDFPGLEYDPEIGIYGMDVIVSIERPGYRIKRRKAQQQEIPAGHKLTKDDSIAFLGNKYGVEVK